MSNITKDPLGRGRQKLQKWRRIWRPRVALANAAWHGVYIYPHTLHRTPHSGAKPIPTYPVPIVTDITDITAARSAQHTPRGVPRWKLTLLPNLSNLGGQLIPNCAGGRRRMRCQRCCHRQRRRHVFKRFRLETTSISPSFFARRARFRA